MPGNHQLLKLPNLDQYCCVETSVVEFVQTYTELGWIMQESRTLEMNNVQDGVWHGRGDTICLGSVGEGSKAFITLHKPPLMTTRSPELCNMERTSGSGEHSWITDGRHSDPLVPSVQLEQH